MISLISFALIASIKSALYTTPKFSTTTTLIFQPLPYVRNLVFPRASAATLFFRPTSNIQHLTSSFSHFDSCQLFSRFIQLIPYRSVINRRPDTRHDSTNQIFISCKIQSNSFPCQLHELYRKRSFYRLTHRIRGRNLCGNQTRPLIQNLRKANIDLVQAQEALIL